MTVQYFVSTDTGLGAITGQAGSLIAALDKVLVNGYNVVALTTITNSGTLATATLVAHGFRDKQYVTISGATGGDAALYNGSFYINYIDADSFTYTMAGTPGGSATGSLAAKVAALGWTKPYSGTNLAVYRLPSGTQFYVRIDDSGTTTAPMVGYESMTTVSLGTNPFPLPAQLASGVYIGKSTTADATARAWELVGDQKHFMLLIDTASASAQCAYWFGDFTSHKAGDAYNCMIIGNATAVTQANPGFALHPAALVGAGHYVARNCAGSVGAVQCGKIAMNQVRSSAAASLEMGATSWVAATNLADSNLWVSPVYITEASFGMRGFAPGLWDSWPCRPLSHLAVNAGSGSLAGKSIVQVNCYNGASITPCVLLEVSNTFTT